METSVVTSKGQVVIPSKLRRKYGIKNGTRVHFYEVNGEIRLVPVTPELIDKNIGLLGTRETHACPPGREKKEREL